MWDKIGTHSRTIYDRRIEYKGSDGIDKDEFGSHSYIGRNYFDKVAT